MTFIRNLKTAAKVVPGLNISSKTAKIGNLNIRYHSGGKGEPLIILHGGGSNSKAWLPNAEKLSHYYRVYIPDLPGCGHSQCAHDDFQMHDYVAFLDGFVTHLKLQRFHLMGHSIGGAIALNYAIKNPYRVGSLVLVSSIGLGNGAAQWVRLLSAPLFRRVVGHVSVSILKKAMPVVSRFSRKGHLKSPLSQNTISMGEYIRSSGDGNGLPHGSLAALEVPTLLIWGSRDIIVPVANAYIAARTIPDCRLQVFESCGHTVYRQKADEFCRVLIRFLSQQKPLPATP